ncbi:MAG: prenyltransferase [Paenibacillaceae bacterium]|nr:prenyltransferase [Paenibacillaceae bacterium]
MTAFARFRKASRSRVLPVMLVPVLLGAAGAYAWEGTFHPLVLLITLIGAASAHLFSNMINDLWDYRSGVDTAARNTVGAISTNSGLLAKGEMPERTFAALTWGLFALAAVCGIALALISGWEVLVFAVLGGLLAYFYVAPPLRFGYRGKGYSEIAILLSFGVLPVAGSYYAQTSHLDMRALLISLPVGLLTTLVLFNHHFLHWQADRAAGKRTLVVVFGEALALRFSVSLLLLALVSLVVAVAVGALPWYALLGLLVGLPFIRLYRSFGVTNPSAAYLPLMGAAIKSVMRCGAVMIASLFVYGLLQL